jgi:hypothetical protein
MPLNPVRIAKLMRSSISINVGDPPKLLFRTMSSGAPGGGTSLRAAQSEE